MRLRTKILLVLVVAALLPALAVGLYIRSVGRGLAADLTVQLHDQLTGIARAQFERTQALAATRLSAQARAVEQAVSIQAEGFLRAERTVAMLRDAGEALAVPSEVRVGDPLPPGLVWASDFDDPARRPSAAFRSPRHLTGTDREPMWISTDHLSITVAPDTDPADIAQLIPVLAELLPAFQEAAALVPEAARWQYLSLAEGVHVAYPAHGGYPTDYDPRTRPWYQEQSLRVVPTWHEPTADVTTGEAYAVRTEGFSGPDGAMRGLMAIDVPMRDMLGGVPLPEAWRSKAAVILAGVADGPGVNDWISVLVSYGDPDLAPPPGTELLATSDAGLRGLLDGLLDGANGMQRMDLGDRDCVWGYTRMAGPAAQLPSGFASLALVLVVPAEVVYDDVARTELAIQGRFASQLRTSGFILVGILLLVVAAAIVASHRIVRPVRSLADAAARVAEGELETRAAEDRTDELGDLARVFNTMVPRLADHMEMQKSMALAREVQQALLPDAPPPVGGVEVCARTVYCDETGGDYYDMIALGDGGLRLVVGDVTGHGVGAALMMSTARALIRAGAERDESVHDVLGAANRRLCADTPSNLFMTAFHLEIDREADRLRWVGAGHDPAILITADGTVHELAGEDLPLAVTPEADFTELDRPMLEPGDVMLIGTDGIWEAPNETDEMFGKPRMIDVLMAHRGESAERIADEMLDAVRAFKGARPQKDDITVVVLRGV